VPKRNQAFDAGRVQGRLVAALDGIELLSSYRGCCDSCWERHVVVRQGGVQTEPWPYYHRAVGSPIVSGPVQSLVALEWRQPGESEEAAVRLRSGIRGRYGQWRPHVFHFIPTDPAKTAAVKHFWRNGNLKAS
jgi:hypothetical protein